MASDIEERISLILEENGLDYRDLAEELGVSPSTTNRWVTGKTEPYKRHCKDIASAYGYRPAWLLTGKGDRYANRSPQPKADALRNAGVIVRNAKSGKLWFAITFPSHMPVINPYVIEVEEPATNDAEPERVDDREEVRG